MHDLGATEVIYVYKENSLPDSWVECITAPLQEEVTWVNDPNQAQICLSTTTECPHPFALLFVFSKANHPPLLPSSLSGCIVVNPDTMEIVSRDISYLTIMVTGQCNADCSYCHLEETRNLKVDKDAAISTLKQLREAYAFEYVRFSGGEPTLDMDLVLSCMNIFKGIRMGISTNGITLNGIRRIPVGWMGFNDMCVHCVKELMDGYVIDMTNQKQSYETIAIKFRHHCGTSSFFSFPILITKDNLPYVNAFRNALNHNGIYHFLPFVETDRYGNFMVSPDDIMDALHMGIQERIHFVYRLMRNKYMSLYYRAPYDDFVDSCYEVLGKENKRSHWIERIADIPIDLSAVSYLKRRRLIS